MPDKPPAPTRAELARELIRYKMEEYSESFCASWLVNSEFELWHAAEIEDPKPNQQYLVSLAKELRTLAELAGGWWVFADETQPDNPGPVYVPMERWMEILAHKRNSQSDRPI